MTVRNDQYEQTIVAPAICAGVGVHTGRRVRLVVRPAPAGAGIVFVRTDEGFEKREVELGRSDDDGFEVVSGLKPGETIAVANTFLLKAELGKSEADHDH